MKYKYLLIAFITMLISLTELSWGDTYISMYENVLMTGDNIVRSIKWLMWGLVCICIVNYKDK